MQIDENTVIKCNNLNEVKDCLDKLQELGFSIYTKYDCTKRLLVFYNFPGEVFLNDYSFYISADRNYINYNDFLKLYNKQIKEKEPNLIVDKTGKIIKVNNYKDKAVVYYTNLEKSIVVEEGVSCKDLKNKLYNGDYYIAEKACQKALKRKEIENKLKALAFELNGNKDIDWDDEKLKYYLDVRSDDKTIIQDSRKIIKHQGTIYCYSEDFKNKAIELIGEKDLKDYLINC